MPFEEVHLFTVFIPSFTVIPSFNKLNIVCWVFFFSWVGDKVVDFYLMDCVL